MGRIFERLKFFLVLLSWALLACSPAWAIDDFCADLPKYPKPQNTGYEDIGQDLDELAKRGYVLIGVYRDFYPYSWLDNDTPRGVDIEIGKVIAEELGLEAKFQFYYAGEDVDSDLRNIVWKGSPTGGAPSNLMMHVPFHPRLACRNTQVVMMGQYANESLGIAYYKSSYEAEPPGPGSFRSKTVGVENDSIADFYLTNLLNGQMVPNMTRYSDMETAMTALDAGEVSAVLGPLGQLEAGLTEKLAINQPPLVGLAADHWTLSIAVKETYRDVAYAVDDAVQAMLADGRMAEIYEAAGLSFQPPDYADLFEGAN